MPDLGPHAIFITAAYGVTFLAIGALTLAILADDRKQRRMLADLERRGIRRRSDQARNTAAKTTPVKRKARTSRSKA
jgi:heme exporter protein D